MAAAAVIDVARSFPVARAPGRAPVLPFTPRPRAETYLPLVRRIAARLARQIPDHICRDDLVSAGVIGLLEAIERFDARRPTDFSSYAEFRIRGAMLDELRRGDPMPRDARSRSKKLSRQKQSLAQQLGREPSSDELAQHLGVDHDTLARQLERLAPVRLVAFEDTDRFVESEGTDPFEITLRAEEKQRLDVGLSRLPARDRRYLEWYYREGTTLRQIGSRLGVTEARACQLLGAATKRLRQILQGPKL